MPIEVPKGRRLHPARLARTALGVALACCATQSGCHELVLPEPAEYRSPTAAGQVYLPSGLEAAAATVTLTAIVDAPNSDGHWQGVADPLGRFVTDLPTPAAYSVDVEYLNRGFPRRWYFGEVWFDASAVSLRPNAVSQPARLELPAELMTSLFDADGSIYDRHPLGGDYAIDFQASSDGHFTIYAPRVGRFPIRFWLDQLHAQMIYTPADSVAVGSADTLIFAPPLVKLIVLAHLRGNPLLDPLEHVAAYVTTTAGRSAHTIRVPPTGPSVAVWALAGTGSVELGVSLAEPYLGRTVNTDFQDGRTVTIELGRFVLNVAIETASGVPVAQAQVELSSPVNYRRLRTLATADDGRVEFYLEPGPYLVSMAASPTAPATVNLVGDTLVTFTIPEPTQ